MNAIIVEDEAIAVKNLQAILMEVAPEIKVVEVLDSVKSSVDYFLHHPIPDLVFMDIQLSDGQSFHIFKSVEITCPVIFTTAYDNFALEAFKVNSIDYVLKPIDPDAIARALDKLRKLTRAEQVANIRRTQETLAQKTTYLQTLLVSYADKFVPIPTRQVAFFYIENEKVSLTTFEGKEWGVDITLDSLMQKLNPAQFFRANRQFIISHTAVKEVVVWFGNRLAVTLHVPAKERILISKARVGVFKKWLTHNQEN